MCFCTASPRFCTTLSKLSQPTDHTPNHLPRHSLCVRSRPRTGRPASRSPLCASRAPPSSGTSSAVSIMPRKPTPPCHICVHHLTRTYFAPVSILSRCPPSAARAVRGHFAHADQPAQVRFCTTFTCLLVLCMNLCVLVLTHCLSASRLTGATGIASCAAASA